MPPKKPIKPHLRRQARQEAAAAESSRAAETFSIRAYEATIVHGQSEYARSMERREGVEGGKLIKWDGEFLSREAGAFGEDREEKDEVWLDRHDILHLLPTLPKCGRGSSPAPSSTGWSDLPSDAEDTFFFSDDSEQEDYERSKKRRKIDSLREQRLKAATAREKVEEQRNEGKREMEARESGDVWGGDDEEPPEAIRQLMSHTITALFASPNPQILELRILTNHAGDPRFSFLKGRYRIAWQRMKDERDPRTIKHRLEETSRLAAEEKEEGRECGIRGLMGAYGDSDNDSVSDSGEVNEAEREKPPDQELSPPPPPPEEDPPFSAPDEVDCSPPPLPPALPTELSPDGEKITDTTEGELARANRRERARQWMLKRKKDAA